jgi:small subunit ribosomal protein S9
MSSLNISAANPAAGLLGAMPAAAAPEQPVKPVRQAKPADKHGFWWGTGRRKTAVARVRLKPASGGEGKVEIRGRVERLKTLEQYFTEERDRVEALAALRVTNTMGRFDLFIKCSGGGFMGQAAAIKMGLARALLSYDPSVEPALREHNLLTRDARAVERKKYGQAGARRRFQFSKR